MKLIRDTGLLFGRSLTVSLRNPVWIILGLFQPILYLLLFAPLLDGLKNAPGFPPGNALNVFTPGLLIMTALFGSAFVGFGLLEDLRNGVIERLRVTPASRLAILLGLVLRDVLTLLIQSTILVVVATLMGLRADLLGLVLLFAMMALIGMMMASVSYAIALAVKSEDSLAATLNTFMVPLQLLSGIILPLTLAPVIIRTIAKANPFAYAVDASRALVNGDLSNTAVPLGFAVIGVLTVLAIFWAARAFRQATA
jgi:ABC-2 type transport system permease protein